jgi:hypothetical protein
MAARPSALIPAEAQQYTRCRTSWQGHDWDDAPAYPHELHVPRGWLTIQFRCARCHMRKTYLFSPRTGETSRPYYSHKPKNYSVKGVPRAEWKQMFVAQYTDRNGGAS